MIEGTSDFLTLPLTTLLIINGSNVLRADV